MSNDAERTICQTPTPGKKPTSIPTWKYDLIRRAILDVLPEASPGIAAKDLPELVRARLSSEDLERLGSVNWHSTTVKLNMEVDKEIVRHPTMKPQHIFKA